MKKTFYHHGDLEQALLNVGISEARASGSRNLGVTHLAKLVSVSPMAVYRHFANGDSLKAEIAQRAREELARRMLAGASKESDTKKRFQAIGRAYIRFGLDERGLFSVAFMDCAEEPKRADDPDSWIIFQDAVLDLCNAGYITPDDVEGVSAIAWSTVHGFATLAGGSEGIRPSKTDQAIDDLMDRLWAGIISAPEPGSSPRA